MAFAPLFSLLRVFFPPREVMKRAKSELDSSELKNADDLRLLNFHISLKIYAVCCRENKVSIKIQLFWYYNFFPSPSIFAYIHEFLCSGYSTSFNLLCEEATSENGDAQHLLRIWIPVQQYITISFDDTHPLQRDDLFRVCVVFPPDPGTWIRWVRGKKMAHIKLEKYSWIDEKRAATGNSFFLCSVFECFKHKSRAALVCPWRHFLFP